MEKYLLLVPIAVFLLIPSLATAAVQECWEGIENTYYVHLACCSAAAIEEDPDAPGDAIGLCVDQWESCHLIISPE